METRTTTPITAVMVLLEEKLRQQVRQDKPLLVAIDGRCASGKSTLAKDLQKQLDCNVIHMDDFYLQEHQRTTRRLREPGENVDYERFETEVLQPLLTGRDVFLSPMTRTQSVFARGNSFSEKSDDYRGLLCLSSETAQKL